jgi:hypothetical protein
MARLIHAPFEETMENEQPITTPEPTRTKRRYKQRVIKTDGEKAIAAFVQTHRYARKEILSALRSDACKPGTNARLLYLKRLEESEIDFAKQMVALGAIPKNAHAQSRTEFIYKAIVGNGGQVSTVPVDEKQLKELDKKEAKTVELPYCAEDEAIRENLEREFGSSAVQQPNTQ